MNLTARDKWLMMIVPTFVVLAIYGQFFLRGKMAEMQKAETALADAKAKAPSPVEVAMARQALDTMTKEIAKIQGNHAALKEKWRYATSFSSEPAQRNARVERLTDLMKKHNLTFLEDSEADSDKDSKVTDALDGLAQKIAKENGDRKVQVRRIRVYGSYRDVQRVLDKLSSGDVLAIPVGLTMKTIDDERHREWQLLVWI